LHVALDSVEVADVLPRRASTLNNAVRVRARVRAEADFGDPFAPAIDVPGARGQLKRNRSSEQLHDRDRLSQWMQFLREKNHAGLFGATEAAAASGGAGIHDSACDDGLGFSDAGGDDFKGAAPVDRRAILSELRDIDERLRVNLVALISSRMKARETEEEARAEKQSEAGVVRACMCAGRSPLSRKSSAAR
jgi:hypothetical protein